MPGSVVSDRGGRCAGIREFVIPIALSGVVLSRRQVIAGARICGFLLAKFGTWANSGEGAAQFLKAQVAFMGVGLFIAETVHSRRSQAESVLRLHQESELREKAEQEARALIESSPAAIITVGHDGKIKMTNSSAKKLLRLEASIEGDSVAKYFPVLGELMTSNRILRLSGTMVEGNGTRRDGVTFFAQMWLSSYRTADGLPGRSWWRLRSSNIGISWNKRNSCDILRSGQNDAIWPVSAARYNRIRADRSHHPHHR